MYQSGLHSIEGAQASSSQARDQLSKTTIYSPLDGVITVLNSKLGERVVATDQFAGTEVMRVADLNRMQAVVDVNENDVVHVKIGDPCKVVDRRLRRSKIYRHGRTDRPYRQNDRHRHAGRSDQFRGEDPTRRPRHAAPPRPQLHGRYPDRHGKRCRLRPDPERDHSQRRQQSQPGRDRKEEEGSPGARERPTTTPRSRTSVSPSRRKKKNARN